MPTVVTTILTYLDNHYPDLEGDEARRSIWLVDVPLQEIHRLRAKINTGTSIPPEFFEEFDVPVVAAVLKLYLLELPDSLVSSHVYEIVKTIYTSTAPATSDDARITIIQSTLGQLRLANIATLDALTTHFTRLIDLTSADEEYIAALATNLAPCILRPRQESSLTMTEKWNYRLLRDLLAHKDPIFGELKRQSGASGGSARPASVAEDGRPRAISTDESNRRAKFEERQRAIQNRGRAPSPNPSTRTPMTAQSGTGAGSHRRDRSVGGPETRFPIATAAANATTSPTDRRSTVTRNSLEVPGSVEASPIIPEPVQQVQRERSGTNGTITSPTSYGGGTNGTPPTSAGASSAATEDGIEKRNSLGRAAPRTRFPTKSQPVGVGVKRQSLYGSGADRSSIASVDSEPSRLVGVELTDKPMDD